MRIATQPPLRSRGDTLLGPISLFGTKIAAPISQVMNLMQLSLKRRDFWCALAVLLGSSPLAADDWSNNLRWSVDAASRTQYITSGDDRLGFQTTLGLDMQTVKTGRDRNIATVTLQLYATRADHLRRRPPYIEEDGEWEFVPKINTVNFHINRNGYFNFLIGHAEIPYGLAVPINTQGTLRQVLTPRNLGLKADWGGGVNGTLSNVSYAMTVTRGTGVEYHSSGNPWALAGRVGSRLNSQDYIGEPGFGLSWFTGNVLTPQNTLVERRRIGLDGQWYRGLFGFMIEVSIGDDDRQDVLNSFVEINRVSRNAKFTVYSQARWLRKQLDEGWQDASSWTIGFRLTPSTRWTISLQYDHELEIPATRPRDKIFNLQFRFRS